MAEFLLWGFPSVQENCVRFTVGPFFSLEKPAFLPTQKLIMHKRIFLIKVSINMFNMEWSKKNGPFFSLKKRAFLPTLQLIVHKRIIFSRKTSFFTNSEINHAFLPTQKLIGQVLNNLETPN
jgi:hypothetical protein